MGLGPENLIYYAERDKDRANDRIHRGNLSDLVIMIKQFKNI